ncbi:MAG: methyl-accepting chemotaxis protein, partial [Pseudomonadota bacterium]
AALVEESAAAAESLKDQAQRLTTSMQVFRLSGSAVALATPVVVAVAPRPATPAVARPAAPAAKPAAARPPEVAQAAISQARETSRPASPTSNDDWESF